MLFHIKSFLRRTVACLLACGLMMSCCACSKEERPENADKTINFHLQEDPSSIDPQITSTFGARVAVEALFEGLVRLDEEGNPYPGAAESWEVSSDGLRYTFHLRKDAKWSKSVVTENGETSVSSDPAPLTARDFVYGWQRAVNPSTECPEAASFSIIKNGEAILNGSQSPEALGVEAVDDHTLVVTLENPSDDFLSLTAMAAFMPCQEDFFLWTSGRYGLEAKYICGNGPFAFYNSYAWDHEEGMKLRRSGSYVGENEVLPAALELYVSEKAVDVSDPVAAVTEERVDLAPISSEQVDKAEKEELQLITLSMDAVWGLCFNTQDDLMKNAEIRKMFIQTLKRENLLEYLPENADVANDIIPSTFRWEGESYRDAAGTGLYLKQDDDVLSGLSKILADLKLDAMPSITVLGPEDSQQMLNQMLITWNGRMGNYFNLETLSESDLQNKVDSGDYQAAVCALRPDGDKPLTLLSMFASDSTSNPAHLQSKQYDKLLEAAASGQNTLNSLVQAETYLSDQGIFYPLYYTDRYYCANSTLTGVVVHAADQGIDFIQAGKLE